MCTSPPRSGRVAMYKVGRSEPRGHRHTRAHLLEERTPRTPFKCLQSDLCVAYSLTSANTYLLGGRWAGQARSQRMLEGEGVEHGRRGLASSPSLQGTPLPPGVMGPPTVHLSLPFYACRLGEEGSLAAAG